MSFSKINVISKSEVYVDFEEEKGGKLSIIMMTEKTGISFQSTEEHERNLMTGTLEQRKEAFKEDEELMRETTKFVTEVIETAAIEASKRKEQEEVIKIFI